MAHHKRGLTNWRGGRGKSGLVSSETWHVTNEDSLPRGEEGGGAGVGELGNVARHNEDSLPRGEEEGGVGW